MQKKISRRSFSKLGVASALAGAISFGNVRRARAAEDANPKSNAGLPLPQKICPVIDCHLHAPSASTGEILQWSRVHHSIDDFVDYLNRSGVDYGVVTSVRGTTGKEADDFMQANREALDLAARYPKRFIPACLVNGRFPDESVRELIDYRTKHGIFWVGELTGYITDYTYDTPGFEKIMDTIAEYDMICHIHARVEQIESLVKKYSQVTFILPHLGPTRKRIFSRIEFVKQHRNVYFDICGVSFSRVGILEHAVREIGEDRVLFGSDFTINDPASVIVRVLNAELPDATKKKILFENAKRLIEKFDKEKRYAPFLV